VRWPSAGACSGPDEHRPCRHIAPRRAPPRQPAPAHLRRRERRGLLVLGRRPADPSGARPGPKLRPTSRTATTGWTIGTSRPLRPAETCGRSDPRSARQGGHGRRDAAGGAAALTGLAAHGRSLPDLVRWRRGITINPPTKRGPPAQIRKSVDGHAERGSLAVSPTTSSRSSVARYQTQRRCSGTRRPWARTGRRPSRSSAMSTSACPGSSRASHKSRTTRPTAAVLRDYTPTPRSAWSGRRCTGRVSALVKLLRSCRDGRGDLRLDQRWQRNRFHRLSMQGPRTTCSRPFSPGSRCRKERSESLSRSTTPSGPRRKRGHGPYLPNFAIPVRRSP